MLIETIKADSQTFKFPKRKSKKIWDHDLNLRSTQNKN